MALCGLSEGALIGVVLPDELDELDDSDSVLDERGRWAVGVRLELEVPPPGPPITSLVPMRNTCVRKTLSGFAVKICSNADS